MGFVRPSQLKLCVAPKCLRSPLISNQGVDIQNQPFSGIWPIPSGESWLCDIATHLKYKVGLDRSNIAVISGGVSGLQSSGGIQNFPNSVFDCSAIDVIGIHGRFAQQEHATAGTPWAEMFIPGNTLTARAQGKQDKKKLLLVEEWEYTPTSLGVSHKAESIFDQATALNLRGIPWVRTTLPSPDPPNKTTDLLPPLHQAWKHHDPHQPAPPRPRLLQSPITSPNARPHRAQQLQLDNIPPRARPPPIPPNQPRTKPLHPIHQRMHFRM